ncbi:MAG: homocysteine S-methyltransferase family protein, partial [Clostridia bacterium]|nr:homocysteine S-methyltransferase family protein [Clostridia bacterium]
MNILEYIKDHTLLLDGGLGSLLQAKGLAAGELPERWNLTHPEVITAIHKDYFDAGSNLVCANTFGANLLKFSEEELESIIQAALENAKNARAQSAGKQEKWIALDVGPSGKMLAPYGDLDFEDAVALFGKTVDLGAKYGADVIFIETMNDSYETKAALIAAKECSTLPVFVSNAYGADGKLMTGADPLAMIAMLEGMGAHAIGMNCSLGPDALGPIVKEYLKYSSLPVILKPNAGLPQIKEGKTVYDIAPDAFAKSVGTWVGQGVRLAGGCCGTTPAYIKALAEELEGVEPRALEEKHYTCVSSYTHGVLFEKEPILIGERINPTGKKRFKEALRAHDIDYILKEGIAQEEKGVSILDVNVGLPEIDEPTMLTEAVTALQSVTDLPLQIDTADPVAMEKALRRYNGKAMVNSVNGKKESMDAVFPLVKKYGGLVVALTLDEQGIPENAEGRIEIAKKILNEAKKYGIDKKDLIFDPLALTVSADGNAAKETLKAVGILKNEMGCHVSLGVSNVSFGLPQREVINSTFFALALQSGLSAAIMNPYSLEMMKSYHAFRALAGLDESCVDYVSFASTLTQAPAPVSTAASAAVLPEGQDGEGISPLQRVVGKGLKAEAAALTRTLLETKEGLTIINEEIIPALDRVGAGFENKTVYLPQLLMSAEAAGAAFDEIKNAAQKGVEHGCPVVLATVQGDIHDIGKNIVKLLLENYGFAVYDLGRDVPPEKIVEKTLELNAPLVGLSALMTTTVPAMEETVRMLREKAPFAKVMVGGAVLTKEYADAMGADFYAPDAMAGVRFA